MSVEKVWDPLVRVFHWSVLLLMGANAFMLDGESMYHRWVGYTVAGFVAARIIWGFIGSHYARFASFPPSARQSVEQLTDLASGRRKIHLGHTPLGALMIYNMLLTIAVICASGYLMTTGMFRDVEWPEVVHQAAVTWVKISVMLHVAAVLLESFRTKVNLPRAMVTGYKKLP
jgi:cytochrome b